jgi:hypothetical protein
MFLDVTHDKNNKQHVVIVPAAAATVDNMTPVAGCAAVCSMVQFKAILSNRRVALDGLAVT